MCSCRHTHTPLASRRWFKSNPGLGACARLTAIWPSAATPSWCAARPRRASRPALSRSRSRVPLAGGDLAGGRARRDRRAGRDPGRSLRRSDLVIGWPFIRFYAGAPLKVERNGKTFKVGTLCVIETAVEHGGTGAREHFSVKEKQMLIDFASMVVDAMELRRQSLQEKQLAKHQYITCTAHDMRTPLTSFQLSSSCCARPSSRTSRPKCSSRPSSRTTSWSRRSRARSRSAAHCTARRCRAARRRAGRRAQAERQVPRARRGAAARGAGRRRRRAQRAGLRAERLDAPLALPEQLRDERDQQHGGRRGPRAVERGARRARWRDARGTGSDDG